MQRNRVDLPDPDGPMIIITSPRFTSILTSSSALSLPKCLETRSIWIISSPANVCHPFQVANAKGKQQRQDEVEHGHGIEGTKGVKGTRRLNSPQLGQLLDRDRRHE